MTFVETVAALEFGLFPPKWRQFSSKTSLQVTTVSAQVRTQQSTILICDWPHSLNLFHLKQQIKNEKYYLIYDTVLQSPIKVEIMQ